MKSIIIIFKDSPGLVCVTYGHEFNMSGVVKCVFSNCWLLDSIFFICFYWEIYFHYLDDNIL